MLGILQYSSARVVLRRGNRVTVEYQRVSANSRYAVPEATGKRFATSPVPSEVEKRTYGLTQHLQGLSANVSEWAENMEAEINNEAGVVQREAMINAKSMLERQKAIHDRYSSLRDLAEQDVAGLSAGRQHAMGKVLDAAREEATRIVRSTKLTAKQKMERLEKVDMWTVQQMRGRGSTMERSGMGCSS